MSIVKTSNEEQLAVLPLIKEPRTNVKAALPTPAQTPAQAVDQEVGGTPMPADDNAILAESGLEEEVAETEGMSGMFAGLGLADPLVAGGIALGVAGAASVASSNDSGSDNTAAPAPAASGLASVPVVGSSIPLAVADAVATSPLGGPVATVADGLTTATDAIQAPLAGTPLADPLNMVLANDGLGSLLGLGGSGSAGGSPLSPAPLLDGLNMLQAQIDASPLPAPVIDLLDTVIGAVETAITTLASNAPGSSTGGAPALDPAPLLDGLNTIQAGIAGSGAPEPLVGLVGTVIGAVETVLSTLASGSVPSSSPADLTMLSAGAPASIGSLPTALSAVTTNLPEPLKSNLPV